MLVVTKLCSNKTIGQTAVLNCKSVHNYNHDGRVVRNSTLKTGYQFSE